MFLMIFNQHFRILYGILSLHTSSFLNKIVMHCINFIYIPEEGQGYELKVCISKFLIYIKCTPIDQRIYGLFISHLFIHLAHIF